MARAEAEPEADPKPAGIRVPGGVFVVRRWPTLVGACMLAVLLALGTWQVERLSWKRGLIAEMQERMQEMPVDIGLSEIPPEDAPSMDYRQGSASGTFENDKELYLAGVSKSGAGGYHVLTPLRLPGRARALLVDRGWVPYGKKDPATRAQGQIAGFASVAGILRLPPQHKPWMRPDNDPAKDAWYWIDLPAMADAAGVKEFLPYVLEADDALVPGGYPLGGQTVIDLPNNHLGYAITWYGLALALLVVYGISGYRRVA